jgi:molybdopterin converting factor small subunit
MAPSWMRGNRKGVRCWLPGQRTGYNPRMPTNTFAKVLFFGRLKEITGIGEDALDLASLGRAAGDASGGPRESSAIEQLFEYYAQRSPQLALFRKSVVASRNREFAAWDTPVHAGDEIAFLPPVSGG